MKSNAFRNEISKILEVEECQIESNVPINFGLVFRKNDSITPYFSSNDLSEPNSEIFSLLSRAGLKHKIRRDELFRYMSDLGVAASAIIFCAGPSIVYESDIHIIAISDSQDMMEAVRAGISNKPKGIWVHYTTITPMEKSFIPKSALKVPLWLYGVLACEHIYFTRDVEAEALIRNLRSYSKNLLDGAFIDVLSELAVFDAYRKLTGQMPCESNFALLFLRAKLEEKGFMEKELMAESDIALRRRNTDLDYSARGLLKVAKSLSIGKDEEEKYVSIIRTEAQNRRKRITPPPLPLSVLVKAVRPNHI
jgi:hypothetical protein